MVPHKPLLLSVAVLAVIVAGLLAGCSPPKPQPHLAATVNGEGITVRSFQRLRDLGPDGDNPTRLLDALIDRALFAQNATKLKLEERPGVAQALDEARTEVLAQAYLEAMTGADPYDAREVERFYSAHPEQFERRRLYRVFELAVVAPPARVAEIRKRAARARGLHEIAEWLKAEQLAFNADGATRSSEHIAPVLLERLSRMKDGAIEVLDVPSGASVVQLIQSEAAPLSREEAAPMIEQLLRARKRAEIAQQEKEHLRSVASIEYLVDLPSSEP